MVVVVMLAACRPAPQTGSDGAAGGAAPDVAAVFDGTAGTWIDLTHSFG